MVILLWLYIVLNSLYNVAILFAFSMPEYVGKLVPEAIKLAFSKEISSLNQLLYAEDTTRLYIFLALGAGAILLNVGLIFVSNFARKTTVFIQQIWVLFAVIMASGTLYSLISSDESTKFSTLILFMVILLPPILILYILNNKETKKLYGTKIQ